MNRCWNGQVIYQSWPGINSLNIHYSINDGVEREYIKHKYLNITLGIHYIIRSSIRFNIMMEHIFHPFEAYLTLFISELTQKYLNPVFEIAIEKSNILN